MPNQLSRNCPMKAPAAEKNQQQKTGYDGRQDKRQVDDAVEERLAPEAAARQRQGDENAERQAGEHGNGGHPQAEPDRRPFFRAECPPMQRRIP